MSRIAASFWLMFLDFMLGVRVVLSQIYNCYTGSAKLHMLVFV